MTSSGDGNGSARSADREATAWFVRLRSPDASEADRRTFRAWLNADPGHAAAFEEVEALWRDLDEPAAAAAVAFPALEKAEPRRFGWRGVAVTAALIAASLIVVVWRDPGLVSRARADHATRPGERLDVALGDGTALTLDGDSAVTERLSGELREVVILRGRVWFDVALDAKRPFVVHADALDVRVLGTAFGVDRDRGLVTVERGSVSAAEGGDHFRLTAGQQAGSAGGRLSPPAAVDAASALAWRRGLIVLDAAPLGEVIREYDRMAGGRMIAPQADVRAMRLSGVFRSDDPEALIEAMRRGLGLSVVEAPGLGAVVYR